MDPSKFVADLSNVAEVSLLGLAELDFWKPRLAAERLQPIPRDGQAQILIVAAAARFRGFTFRELSISVLAQGSTPDPVQPGAFLLQAFNSRRFFAWAERTFFHTPYAHAQVAVQAALPASVSLTTQPPSSHPANSPILSFQMTSSPPRQPLRRGVESWDGPIYLPVRSAGQSGKLFFARLTGQTEVFPFASGDRWDIQPLPQFRVLSQLQESGFRPHEWQLRPASRHSKTKTFARPHGPATRWAPCPPPQ